MIRFKILILIALVFPSPAFSLAQQSNATAPYDKAGEIALKAKAYELLESLATQISTLQSAENRARIGSNIAWSLWPHNEIRARALFVSVGQDIRLGYQPRENEKIIDDRTLNVFLQLRTDTIDRIAKYDPEFAFDFLKTTEPPSEHREVARERELALELRLAKQVVNANPDLALKLGRRALANGVSEELYNFLRSLLRKHRKQGVTLHKEIVGKLRNVKLTEDYRLLDFTLALAHLTPPLADETTYGELTNILVTVNRALKCGQGKEYSEESAAPYLCNLLAPLVGRDAKLQPTVADSENRAAAEAYSEFEEVAREGDIDGLLQLAEKHPSLKPTIYWRAFDLAGNLGDLERIEKIAAAFVGPAKEKQRMLEMVARAKDTTPLSEAQLQEIQRYAETITDLRERADQMAAAAVRVGANNRAFALKLLDQATELIETHKQGGERTQFLVSLAMNYSMEKSDRGFSIMESQMPRLNELIDAAVKLDGFDTHYVREGEWNMSSGGELGQLLTSLSSNAPYFAWCDFDRAVNLAAQFERTEIRMMAQLKLAQGILAGPPKPIRKEFRD